ncbi:hypothetical protein ABRQ22_06715 [Cellulosimicrobium sp. ES-005]|uniref:Phage portal protein n=1 Tax=Cellulosimicrobium sp. ES-005 TaxID=3163031 RepID=A0AAU8G3X4_9MICO
MAFWKRKLREVESIANYAGQPGVKSRLRPATPHSENTLRSVAYADILGVEHAPITRDEAITVPAVAAGRWLICNPLSRQPLRAYTAETDPTTGDPVLAADQPAWLAYTGGITPWQFRTMHTLDDLIFEGWSLWRVTRDATAGWTTSEGEFVGAITGAVRVPLDRWDFDADDQVVIDGIVQDHLDVILFQSPMDPLLLSGRRTIRGARMLEDQWVKGLDAVPVMEIKQTEDIELEDSSDADADPEAAEAFDEAKQIVDDYVAARRQPNGAVVFTPYGYELVPHGAVQPDMYVNGRNFQVLDVARHLALPPHLMGASQVAASLTYNSTENGRSDYRDLVQTGWAMALEARLSMDDVVPPGVRVAFDLSDLAERPDDGLAPITED